MKRDAEILVGVDGSAASMHALDWAAAEARTRGRTLHVVCSYTLPSFTAASLDGGYAALDDTAIQQGARAVLSEARQRAQAPGLEVVTTVATGDAAAVLVEMSRDASLAVVGTRGKGGFADRLLGTVSSTLPAHAYCPTVVVPLRDQRRGGVVPADESTPVVRPVRRMIVGVDGSPQADLALRHAIDEAEAWGAELTAVAGVPVGSGSGVMAWLPATIDQTQVLADVTEGLNVVVDRALADRPGTTVKRVVLDGTGAELLTEFSTATDLIVVGSRGRGGFTGLLLGSTSQAVLHHAACPSAAGPA
jgi:nucleotide-binding universal stress UspA family protein